MTAIIVKIVGTTLTNTDGTVRSLNPDGPAPTTYHWESRPTGTNGSFEQMTIDGGIVTYNPLGNEPVMFPFQHTVPNAPGFSGLGLVPLT